MKKPKTADFVYNNDRWRVPGTKEVYQVRVREFNGVGHWELYHSDSPRHEPRFVFGAIGDRFAVQLKGLYNLGNLVKVRTPVKDRIGPRLYLWGLAH